METRSRTENVRSLSGWWTQNRSRANREENSYLKAIQDVISDEGRTETVDD
jgi:hypothetical protein